jgi:purine-binding chemotaxis protein CheW
MPNSAPHAETELTQLIVFRLADEDFAIPIGEIREIIRSGPVTPVPSAPKGVHGVINVRGEIAAVVDLKIRFGLPDDAKAAPKHVVIAAQGKNLFALLVDEVVEVLRIAPNEIKAPPELTTNTDASCLAGVITKNGRLIILLDLAKCLLEDDLLAVRRAVEGP